jgi:Lon protease-like protein
VGLIRECVRTADGRYFINLVGICRARVLEEDHSGDYRRAHVEPLVAEVHGPEQDGEFAAAQLCRQILHLPAFDGLESARNLRRVCGNSMSLEQLVDLMAAALLPAESVEIRQLILRERCVLQRAEVLLSELQGLARSMHAARARGEQEMPGSLMN